MQHGVLRTVPQKRREKPMRSLYLTAAVFYILFAGAHVELAQAGHIATTDSNIHFAVWDGTAWVDIAPPAAAGTATGTYIIPERTSANPVAVGGGNTITVQKLTSAENIRVEWNDDLETFWLKNVKISSATAIADLRFLIWRKFTTSGSELGNMYYDARGGGWLKRANGASAVNAKIVIRGSIETPAGTGSNNYIKNLAVPPTPLPCSPRPDKLVKCVPTANSSSTISWNDFEKDTTPHSLVNPDHMVTMEFWLTLPHGGGVGNKDFLQLASTTTGGIRLMGTSSPGAGGTEECDHCQQAECATCPDCGDGTCPDGSQCVSCIKESEYDWLDRIRCSWFGKCPACIIPDIRAERPDKNIRIP